MSIQTSSVPAFYLSTAGEGEELASPRACWSRGRLRDRVRDDHMLIEIDPPLVGQKYGLGARDIDRLILSTRYQGTTLYPVSEWPCHVYVARILDEAVIETASIEPNQVEIVAWGIIFRNLDEARAHADKFRRSG